MDNITVKLLYLFRFLYVYTMNNNFFIYFYMFKFFISFLISFFLYNNQLAQLTCCLQFCANIVFRIFLFILFSLFFINQLKLTTKLKKKLISYLTVYCLQKIFSQYLQELYSIVMHIIHMITISIQLFKIVQMLHDYYLILACF